MSFFFFSVELIRCVKVNAAAESADKSFRLDYKKLSLKLSRAPSRDKEYSGPISVFAAEPLVFVTISACQESLCVCVCVTPLHPYLDVLLRLHICKSACVPLLLPGAHMNPALTVCTCLM